MKSRKHKSRKNECIKALEKKKWNKRSLKNSKVKQNDLEKLFKNKRKNQGLHLCENRKFFLPFIPQHEKNEDGIKLRKSNRIRSHDYSSSPNGSMLYRIDLGEYFWFETGKNWGWMSTINKCQNRHQSTIIKCKNNQLVYRTFCFRQLIYAIRKTKWNPSNSCSCTAKKKTTRKTTTAEVAVMVAAPKRRTFIIKQRQIEKKKRIDRATTRYAQIRGDNPKTKCRKLCA